MGDVARALYRDGLQPQTYVLPDEAHEQVDRICREAPPHVREGMLSQIGLPADVIWVELPSSNEGEGSGILAQSGSGRIEAHRIFCDQERVWPCPLYGIVRPSAIRPHFDWSLAMARHWKPNKAADRECERWALAHVNGALRPQGNEEDANWLVLNVMKPDLITLVLMFSPFLRTFQTAAKPDGNLIPVARPGRA
jgi:hypothetical protein